LSTPAHPPPPPLFPSTTLFRSAPVGGHGHDLVAQPRQAALEEQPHVRLVVGHGHAQRLTHGFSRGKVIRISAPPGPGPTAICPRSEEHTSELQSLTNLVCRLLL